MDEELPRLDYRAGDTPEPPPWWRWPVRAVMILVWAVGLLWVCRRLWVSWYWGVLNAPP